MPARVNYVPKKILTQKLTLYKKKRGVFERFLVKKRFKPVLTLGTVPGVQKRKSGNWIFIRNLNRRLLPLVRARCSFRLTHSPHFRQKIGHWGPSVQFWRMPHRGTSRFVPPVSTFRRGSFQRRPGPAGSVPRCPGGSPLPGSCPSWGEWPDAGA